MLESRAIGAEPLIRVENLTKHFPVTRGLLFTRTTGQVKAVDGVSFTIGRQETLGLVGESGCGKTTTSRLLLRLERPTAGRVLLDGRDVHALTGADLSAYHTRVQAVFQDPWSSLNPRLRIRDTIAEALVVNRRVSRAGRLERIEEVLHQVGLSPGAASRYPHEFSGGQRQRIALASALASFPELIVLDEPVSALDVSIRAQIMNLLKDLQAQQQLSYLLVAHNLATVRYIAHRTAVMYLGRIVEHAGTESLYRSPLHPYTKALFAASLPADPDAPREDLILSGEVPSPIDPPSGCHFHPRCPFAMAQCSRVDPELKAAAPDHMVACHLY
ncbi:MAG: peptide ABC transporter substrate-binding protein [Candidatus Rokuibacteriota bacterium]|nr:MAG: peptide ABC transporter substrate-binding protein [Candidatus Rokubacteria bacterium]PYN77908.1 MAG: peptide ABC transporter substrate-binding protein [Candidatus Rokubacteria bacterium]